MIRIAHRSGAHGDLPEQTVFSAKLAMANGADFIEIDTRFLSDGEIAISHDLSLKRVYGIDKKTCDMTLGEFRSFRHARHPEYTTHTLADYLDASIQPLLIHIKEGGKEKLTSIINLLKKYSYENRTALGVQSANDAVFVKNTCQNIKVLAFMTINSEAGETIDTEIDKYLKTDVDFIRLWESWVTPERIARIHGAKKHVWVMACNTEVGYTTKEQLHYLESLGIDGILLNDITFER